MRKKNKGAVLLSRAILAFIVLNAVIFGLLPFYVLDLFESVGLGDVTLTISVIVYAYFMAAPYFIALVMCHKLSKLIISDRVFSSESIRILSTIAVCSVIEGVLCGVGSALYAILIGGKYALILLFLAVTCCSAVILAAIFSSVVRNAIRLKEENELTI